LGWGCRSAVRSSRRTAGDCGRAPIRPAAPSFNSRCPPIQCQRCRPDGYSAWPYDAIGGLSAAINKAGSTDPNKIRAAILSTKGYKGAEGEYNFDEFGDGLHGYNIVRNEKGTIVFDKHIQFTD
jgi:hypothetical protein